MEKIYEKYEIIPNITKLRAFRKAYIDSLNKPVLHKIITNKPFFYYSKTIYENKKGLFELGIIPLSKDDSKVINSFIEFGTDNYNVKAIKHSDITSFVAIFGSLDKIGIKYKISPVIILNEDLYNLIKIQNRDFDNITVDNLSKYSDFFNVKDKPYSIISDTRLEDMYRTGEITNKEYRQKEESLNREERLVKTLRK